MTRMRSAPLMTAALLFGLTGLGALVGGCATSPILLKELPQSRNDLFPETGTCPAQFAFLQEEGIVIVEEHREKSYTPIKGVKRLIALPPGCNNNFTLWYSGESVHLYDAIVAPVLEALKENNRFFNASVVEPEGWRVPTEDFGNEFVTIRVPVPVKEANISCLDDDPKTDSQNTDDDFMSGKAFGPVRVRYFFSYGQLVVLVPKAKNKPQSPDEETCISRWKTSPATAKIPRTQLPVVLERDDESEISPRRVKKKVPVTGLSLDP